MCDSSIVKRFLGVKNPEIVEKMITEIPDLIALKREIIVLNQKINKEHAK